MRMCVQVDVIVNTVAQDLDLSQGAVSSSLLAVAGPGIQQECRTQVPAGQRLGVGTIIRTSGHQLRCKDVLHGPCIKWDAGAGNCEQVTVSISLPSILFCINIITRLLCSVSCVAAFISPASL